ncbi:MAG: hypothetical protein ACLFUH_03230 [Bacteroidales bacterium]
MNEENNQTGLPLWEKLGNGTMRLKTGYRVKPQERFRAKIEDIPLGGRDLVKMIEEGAIETAKKEEEQQEIAEEEQKEHGSFVVEKRPNGAWYDVKSSEGVVMNDKALRIDEAEQLRDKLNNNN